MKILGLDPGFDGGLAIIDSETMEIVSMDIMPILEMDKKKTRKVRKTDAEYGKQKTKTYVGKHRLINITALNQLIKKLKEDGIDKAYLESVHAMPTDGVSSSFKFGQNFGHLEAYITAHDIPLEYVTPQAWTKRLHKGVTSSINAKGKSAIVAHKLYPKANFILKVSKPHDGLIDSVLIATYGAEIENEG